MPIVVNTNASATEASFNLSRASEQLRKSLARLSSGDRITRPAEDAGGLAVAYKLDSHAKRTEAVLNNHQNALSYLQLQDGALNTVGDIVTRMSELRTMAADVSKNTSDIENYSKEFRELQMQLRQVAREKFNGVSLFAITGGTTSNGILNQKNATYNWQNPDGVEKNASYSAFSRTLLTHPSGIDDDGNISLNTTNLSFVLSVGNILTRGAGSGLTMVNLLGRSTTGTAVAAAVTQGSNTYVNSDGFIHNIASVSIGQFTEIVQKVADARAENGAEQQRVQTSYNLHSQNLVNLENARGRIMDTDMALESTRFARYNVLVQASASMTAQANQLTNVALTLLQ
jgi:flagellin